MKHYQSNRVHLEGDTILVVSPEYLRTTQTYSSAQEASAAYAAIPGTDYPAPWPIQTRAEAKAAGQRYYYTGRLCKRNHARQRLVSGGACASCHGEDARRYRSHGRQERVTVQVAVYRCQVQELRQHVSMLVTTHGPAASCKECG